MSDPIASLVRKKRDFEAHAPARAAAAIWGDRYVASGLGLMGFWDTLPRGDKMLARRVAHNIRHARDE